MAFVANPLSLSIPPASFEAWLRDNGHLQHLDMCALDQHRPSRSGFVSSLSAFAVNPFETLTVDDLSRNPVPWTGHFWDSGHGFLESYGLPISGTQLKLRMGDNLKRYMGNYLRLSMVILACFIYQMPLSLCGLLLILALWEGIRMVVNYFKLGKTSLFYQAFLLFGKIVTAIMMIYFKVALAVFWAGISSFAVMIVHSSLRKITSSIGNVKPRKRQ